MKRVDRCFGFCLWRGKRVRVELWVCLEEVRPHRHPGQAVEVLPLFGWGTFWRVGPAVPQVVVIGPGAWGRRWLSIPAGWPHWFMLRRKWPLVFVNRTFNGQSAADNFVTN